MHIRTFLKPFSFIPAILIMYMIFMFSSQNGEISSSVSYKVSYTIVKTADHILDAGLEEWQIEDYAVRYNGVTRKIAHMGEYFLLAVAISFPLYVYGMHGILLVLVSGIFCIAFACTDEYHQSFVSGRAPQLKDVYIDSAGVLVGILLVRIVGFIGRHTIFRPIKHEYEDQLSRKEIKRMKKQQARMQKEIAAAGRRQRKNQSTSADDRNNLSSINKEEQNKEEPENHSAGNGLFRKKTDRYHDRRDEQHGDYDEDRRGNYDGYHRGEYDRYDHHYDQRRNSQQGEYNRYDPKSRNRYNRHHDSDYDDQYNCRRDGDYDDRYDRRRGGDYDDQYKRRHDGDYDDQYKRRHDGDYDDRYDRRHDGDYDNRYDDRYGDTYDDRYDDRYRGTAYESSDDLAEDMPLSHILRRKK